MSTPRTPGDLAAARRAILAEARKRAPADGWSMRLLDEAAEAAGVSRSTLRLAYPRGQTDLLRAFFADGDRRMAERLAKRKGYMDLPMRERIALGVRARLEVDQDIKPAARSAAAALALPMNAPIALSALMGTVDAIWRAAGDEARDVSYFTKRMSLAAAYAPTVIHWLSDESEGQESTWAFLDARLSDVMRAGKAFGKLRDIAARSPPAADILARFRAGTRSRGRARD